MALKVLNKITGIVSILLSILVVIPLTVKAITEGGGPWGFEIVSLAILVPLSCYLLFGIAGVIANEELQRKYFIAAHILTIVTGVGGYFIFPVYPFWVAIVPIGLAVAGIASHRKFTYFLLVMMGLSIIFNIVLMKWELDFGRTIPLFQLFQASDGFNP
jgi:hypothetical protein